GGSLLAGQVAGHGEVAWSPEVRWDLKLSGQGLDPSALRPDLPGKLAFAAATRGALAAGGPAATVNLDSLRGTLRQQPVAAAAAQGRSAHGLLGPRPHLGADPLAGRRHGWEPPRPRLEPDRPQPDPAPPLGRRRLERPRTDLRHDGAAAPPGDRRRPRPALGH